MNRLGRSSLRTTTVRCVLLFWPGIGVASAAQPPPTPVQIEISQGPFLVLPAEADSLVQQIAQVGDILQPLSGNPPAATLHVPTIEADLAQLDARIGRFAEALKEEGFPKLTENFAGEPPIDSPFGALSANAQAAVPAVDSLTAKDLQALRADLLHPSTPTPADVTQVIEAIRSSRSDLAALSSAILRKALLDAANFTLRRSLPDFVFVDATRRRAVRPNSSAVLRLEVPPLTEAHYAEESLESLIGYWRTVKESELYDEQDTRLLDSLRISPFLIEASTPPVDRLLDDLTRAKAAVEAQTRLIAILHAMTPIVPWDCATRSNTDLWNFVFSPSPPTPPRFGDLSGSEKQDILKQICVIKTIIKDDKQSDPLAEWYAVSRRPYRLDFHGRHFSIRESRSGQPLGTLDLEPIEFGPFVAPISVLWSQASLLSPVGLQTRNPELYAFRANEWRSAIASTVMAPQTLSPSTRVEYQKQLFEQQAQLELEQRSLARQYWRDGRTLLASATTLAKRYQNGRIWPPAVSEVAVSHVSQGTPVKAGENVLTTVPIGRRVGTFKMKRNAPFVRFLTPGELLRVRLTSTAGPNLSQEQSRRLAAATDVQQARAVLRSLFQLYLSRTDFQARVRSVQSVPESEDVIVDLDIELVAPAASAPERLTIPAGSVTDLTASRAETALQGTGLWESGREPGVPLVAGSLRRGTTYSADLSFSRAESQNRYDVFLEALTW